MNTRQVRTLAIVLFVLLAAFFATRLSDNQGGGQASVLLLPGLSEQINDISQLRAIKAGESTTIRHSDGQWVVREREDYPADTGKLRKLLLELAEARKIEEKTSNPDLYARLGVEDSSADSQGTELRISAGDTEFSLIVGNLAQRQYRYARIAGEAKSWLIDQNPSVPNNISAWLLQDILDVDSDLIQSVTITHDDGETIHIEKDDRTARDFSVPDIPEGRELSYASVVDSIAGVVSGLKLQDVARAGQTEADDSGARAVYRTFDGLEIAIDSVKRENDTWITVSASQGEAAPPAVTGETAASEQATDAATESAESINDRLGGWTYKIQSYKADQLRRRWDNILKGTEEEE